MIRILFLCLSCMLVFGSSIAGVFPAEGARLHYRRVGFSFQRPATGKCVIEIAEGTYFHQDSFKKNVIVTGKCSHGRAILDVPAFDREYTWRIVTHAKGGVTHKSDFYHFSTYLIPEADTNRLRFRVLKPNTKYGNYYVFVDGSKTLYDMEGKPVWFLPMKDTVELGRSEVRDLKASPEGTITFIKHDRAYEMNYIGDTLWQTPEDHGGVVQYYHHEFTRLSNGHYMVLGTESMFWPYRFGPDSDSNAIKSSVEQPGIGIKNSHDLKIDFGTILEYDKSGKLIWSWKSSNYFLNSDLIYYKPEHRTKVIDVHENAFFFDEADSVVYISFKNISRILKIHYPDGKVLNAYGERYKPGVPPVGNGLFCDQHACRHSRKGYLFVYDNNACNDSAEMPKVLIMKESAVGDTLTKVWEYMCDAEGVNINSNMKDLKARQKYLEQNHLKRPLGRGSLLRATSGGNVIELPDHSLFVCMNTQYGKIFIVNPEKKVLWSAIPERKYPNNEWYIMPQQYRASIISRAELDRIIMNSLPAGKS